MYLPALHSIGPAAQKHERPPNAVQATLWRFFIGSASAGSDTGRLADIVGGAKLPIYVEALFPSAVVAARLQQMSRR